MLIPRSEQGDRLTLTRSSDLLRVVIGRFSPDAARSYGRLPSGSVITATTFMVEWPHGYLKASDQESVRASF